MGWRVSSPGKFYDCSESTVVYFDTASGNTHLVSEFAAHLINCLSNGPLELHQIIDQARNDIAPQDFEYVSKLIPGFLNELLALDIVELT